MFGEASASVRLPLMSDISEKGILAELGSKLSA